MTAGELETLCDPAAPPVIASAPGDQQCDAERRAALRERARELREQAQRLLAQSDALAKVVKDYTRHDLQDQSQRSRKDSMQRSAYARLVARLGTMPVIEQAKGIIMVQSRCGEADAFDILRRVSQRCNVPVRDLAAQLVAKTAQSSTEVRASSESGIKH
jgi:hypothetical protein